MQRIVQVFLVQEPQSNHARPYKGDSDNAVMNARKGLSIWQNLDMGFQWMSVSIKIHFGLDCDWPDFNHQNLPRKAMRIKMEWKWHSRHSLNEAEVYSDSALTVLKLVAMSYWAVTGGKVHKSRSRMTVLGWFFVQGKGTFLYTDSHYVSVTAIKVQVHYQELVFILMI